MRLLSLLLLVATLGLGCSHQKTRYDQNGFISNEKEGEGLQAQVVWLKNKKNQIDILVNLLNRYSEPIRLQDTGISLTFNGENIPLFRSEMSGQMAPNSFDKVLLFFNKTGKNTQEGVALLTIGDVKSDFGKDSKIPNIPPLKLELEVRSQN
jgi:hypothetical protein